MFKYILALVLFTLPSFADGPALWKISDEDTTINILGTIHVLKPGTVWLNEDLRNVVNKADTLYLELSPEQQSPQVMQSLAPKYGLLPEGDSLDKHLPAEAYEKLKTELGALGIPEQGLKRFKPWLAGVTYAGFKFVKLGYNPLSGVEATLTGFVQAQGIKIDGLETAEFQLSQFDGLSDEAEIAFVEQILADETALDQQMESMTDAWIKGDTKALDALINSSNDGTEEIREKIFFERNKNWVDDIQKILDKPGNYVIAVGAGHLVGEGSVIDLLPQAGIEVTRVQ
ncbi:TraB/GumN family protein [Kordiimonas sp. SCSIO 12610]|uniref:TraB/GumN family protein n=1 Tax=Kordiimonas sp. SCSIO 12610 TaxID=2829597 RepID=UPI00210A3AB1|nr:TraB/GumN family protein [Kordiimonas sp. SCSIO 12610]UTW54514.1 TraB/GumN family protein [Kordiimonas sp. SCSIO 12610]